MTNNSIKLAASTAMLLGLMSPAFGEIKLNDHFAVSGYLAGSYSVMDPDPGTTSDRLDVDSALVLFKTDYSPVTAVASVYHVPNVFTDILDAYVTYTASNGVSITGGRYLSYLGYESFFNVNNKFISFANGDFLGAIPGYHSGVKLDYSAGAVSFGASVADSEYFTTPFNGDGELRTGIGYEAYVAIKSIPKLTLWAGVAIDRNNDLFTKDAFTYNVWGEYALADKVTLAAEYAAKDAGTGLEGYNWLAMANFGLSDKLSIAGRVSGEDMDGGPSFMKYSVAPAVAVTEQLTVRLEASYYDYKDHPGLINTAMMFGVQGAFKF